MTSVLRTTRFNEQPLLLVRARRPDADDVRIDDVPPREPHHDAPVTHDQFAPPEQTLSTPALETVVDETPVVVSYEEYEARFRDELDALRAQAREEGHAEGLAQGQRDGESEFSERLRLVDELFVSARDAVEKHLDGMADTAVEITFEAITRILGDRFIDKSGTEAAVREVIRQSKERSKLVVRVAPADFEALSSRRAELVDGLNVGQVELVADDLVELGGCVLETPSGSLDGRLEIQLQRLRDTLLNARLKWHEHGD
jgi:flagellar assembly protein FliH